MIALRYGTPPIVHRDGRAGRHGHRRDRRTRAAGTGFGFERGDARRARSRPATAFRAAVHGRRPRWEALARPRHGRRLRLAAGSAPRYVEAYRARDRDPASGPAERSSRSIAAGGSRGPSPRGASAAGEWGRPRWSGRDPHRRARARAGTTRLGNEAPGGGLAPDDTRRDAGGRGIGELGQARVPVAVLQEDGPGGVDVEAGSAPRPWRGRRPRSSPGSAPNGGDRVAEVVERRSAGSSRHERRSRRGMAGRIEQDQRRRPDAGPRQRRGRPSPPQQWPTTWSSGTVEPRRPDRSREIRGVWRGSDDGPSSARSGRGRAGRPQRLAVRPLRGPARSARTGPGRA